MTVDVVAQIIGKPTMVHEKTLEGFMDRRQMASRADVSPAMIKMATVPETAEIFQKSCRVGTFARVSRKIGPQSF